MREKNYFFQLSSLFLILFTFAFNSSSNSQMVWNQAGNFSGSASSYVSVKNSSTLNINGSFSLEAWINPVENLGTNQTIIAKSTALAYSMRLTVTGKILIATGGTSRMVSKTVVPKNTWTHIAGTYSSITNNFFIYINGVFDSSAIVAGAIPPLSNDSLYIGNVSGTTPFKGYIDEIRIWNKPLSSLEVSTNFNSSLGATGGIYSSLVMSMTFQDVSDSGSPFSLADRTANNNNGINRGITAFNLSHRPSSTISLNQSAELDGTDDFLTGANSPDISPTSAVTLEAWIYPRVYSNAILFHKGPDNGASAYRLGMVGRKLYAIINGVSISSNDTIPLQAWSHVAFTYKASTGNYIFYLNGNIIDSGTNMLGPINTNTDSLYIGGTNAYIDFNGYIDEARLFTYPRTQAEINSTLYTSMDNTNLLFSSGSTGAVVYNLDGLTESSLYTSPRLNFRNNSRFSSPSTLLNQPVSPLDKSPELNFQKSFYLKTSDRRIPQTGTNGSMRIDSLEILLDESISDVNFFIALNHTNVQNLRITLEAPNGDDVEVSNSLQPLGYDNSMNTIFDDQADSSVNNVSRYYSFSPVIRPSNNMNSVFAGDNTAGIWRLRILDNTANDTGRVYAWGIQFNNATSKSHLLLTNALIQGFYNDVTNQSVRDTVRYYFRHNLSPFPVVDSVKLYIPVNGTSLLSLSNVTDATDYYIQLKHRNSITTWSSVPVNFDPLTSQADYRFNTSASQAFNNNQIEVDTSPIRYAIYSGDVNQNKYIDLTDVTLTYNDASSFVSGYKVTDVNGDNISDLFDLLIVYNNSSAFVQAFEP